jgi:hypothetical protein
MLAGAVVGTPGAGAGAGFMVHQVYRLATTVALSTAINTTITHRFRALGGG